MGQTETPKISVIIPAYNQAAYLRESIDSVLAQTRPDFELVVVDDGSTDHTLQVLAEYRDPRLLVVRQPNAGLSAARNTGIRESSAPLVTLLDSDDFFYPEKLAVLSAYLDQHPEVGMVSGGTVLVDQCSEPLREANKFHEGLDLPSLLMGNPFTPSAVMFRRPLLARTGLFDESLRACEDWDLWLRMAYAGCQFAWVDQPVVAYRYHSGQMTRESERMRKALLMVLDKFFGLPELPASIQVFKEKAYASALVTSAAYAYHAENYTQGKHDLAEAARLDPSLGDDRYHHLAQTFRGWAEDPRSADPVQYLRRVIAHPPKGLKGFSSQLRKASAELTLGMLFHADRAARRAHGMELISALFAQPRWLLNRGVLCMLADALLF
jgi:glycosyltransferase involved in cell wall biosynthesis